MQRSPLGTDGLLDLALTFDGRIFATANLATPAVGGRLAELTFNPSGPSFSTGPVRDTGAFSAGMSLDPVSGHLIYVMSNTIKAFNPFTNVATTLAVPTIITLLDGVVVSNDGNFVWVADLGGKLLQFNITRNASLEPIGLSSQATVCTVGNPDGVARGLKGTCLQNFVLTNTNFGALAIHDLTTAPGGTCNIMASGGTRGDFVKTNCKGWLYATQTSSIALVREVNGSPAFECANGCEALQSFANQLTITCLKNQNSRLSNISTACDKFRKGGTSAGVGILHGDIEKLCAELKQKPSPACEEKMKALIIGIANFLQLQTGEPAQSFIPIDCGVTVPVLP